MKAFMPQRCPLPLLYVSWLLYPSGFAYFLVKADAPMAAVWAVAFPVALWGYVKVFPAISQYLGYGRVDDVAPKARGRQPVHVTMFSSMGCPFCPIVERRLMTLQKEMDFDMDRVDLTVRPDLARAKRIGSVPVVEVGERRIVGHATSEELAALIADVNANLS